MSTFNTVFGAEYFGEGIGSAESNELDGMFGVCMRSN
jgi:hypothetical protein